MAVTKTHPIKSTLKSAIDYDKGSGFDAYEKILSKSYKMIKRRSTVQLRLYFLTSNSIFFLLYL